MRCFLANLVTGFILFPRLRRRVRNKIMQKPVNCDKKCENQTSLLEQKQNYSNLKSEWMIHNNNTMLIPGRFREYDLVFCLGATCHGTTLLNSFNLLRFSSPFDWTGGTEPANWFKDIPDDSQFRQKIQAICNNFKDWASPEDFKNVSQFIEKNQRRKENLYKAIDKSQKILIVWIANIWDQVVLPEKTVPDEDIQWAVSQLNTLYPDKFFDFVFFEHNGTKKRFEYEKIEIVPSAFRIKSNHFITDSEYNFLRHVPKQYSNIHVISECLDNIYLSSNAFRLSDDMK